MCLKNKGLNFAGLKRTLEDPYERDSRRDRRDDFLADDGRSRYSATVSSPPRFEGGESVV